MKLFESESNQDFGSDFLILNLTTFQFPLTAISLIPY